MAPPIICRLCVSTCDDFRSLYDESGQGNALYDIAQEYFHPKIVDMEVAQDLNVICSECCKHIYDFHSFQTYVTVAQLKLLKEDGKVMASKKERSQNCESNFLIYPSAVKVEESCTLALSPEETGDSKFRLNEAEGARAISKCHNSQDGDNLGANDDTSTLVMTLIDSNIANIGTFVDAATVVNTAREFITCPKLELPDNFSQSVGYISPSDDIAQPKLEIMDVDPADELNSEDDDELALMRRAANSCIVEMKAPLATDDNDSFDYHPKTKHLKLDALVAKRIPTLKCVACPLSYPTMSLLQDHFGQKHPNEEFYISCCSRKFKHRRGIRQHFLVHYNPNNFKCDLCDKAYESSLGLKYHMTKWHPENPKFVCKLCSKGFSTHRGLQIHYGNIHSRQSRGDGCTVYTCHECGQISKTLSSFRMHQQRHRAKPAFNCDICGKSFKISRDLCEHVAVHRNKHIYACAFCPKTYRKMSSLVGHRKNIHPNESNRHFYTEIVEDIQDRTNTGQFNESYATQGPSTSAKSKDDISQVVGGYIQTEEGGGKNTGVDLNEAHKDTKWHISLPESEIMDKTSSQGEVPLAKCADKSQSDGQDLPTKRYALRAYRPKN